MLKSGHVIRISILRPRGYSFHHQELDLQKLLSRMRNILFVPSVSRCSFQHERETAVQWGERALC